MTKKRALIPAVLAGMALLAAPSGAQAGPLLESAEDCGAYSLSQPFLPWLDPMWYTLVPNGGLERGASGWTRSGGATVVHGNESHYVRDESDSRSLSLPSGSSATTATMCVGVEEPTLRLFVRRLDDPLSALEVEVLFETEDGEVRSATIGTVAGGTGWDPTPQLPVLVNLVPLLPDERTPVRFRFTPVGGGDWWIDDVYVDPKRRS